MGSDPAIRYGCADPECGYATVPSTMGTPYTACPLCGGPWRANPPSRIPPAFEVQTYDVATGKNLGPPKPVPPHLASMYRAKLVKRTAQ